MTQAPLPGTVTLPLVPPAADPTAPGADHTRALDANSIQEAVDRSRAATRALPDFIAMATELLAGEGYTVRELLGRGGNGIVFLADDQRLQRSVAIKALLPGVIDDPVERKAFLEEARTLAKFAQENIVQIFDVREPAGLTFLVMEYIEGESLTSHVARRGPLPERDALVIILGVLRGMQTAHEAGILHRDIKPENVLLTRAGLPKVLDFGLAAVRNLTIHDPSVLVGTPSFMAPEQAAGQPHRTQSDLYSVALLLWFMLTATRPHSDARSPQEVIAQARAGKLVPIANLRPDLSEPLRAVLTRALAVEAPQRFPDAAALRAACEQALLREGYRIRARRRWGLAVKLSAGAALAAGLLFGAWYTGATESEDRVRDFAGALRPAAEAALKDIDARRFVLKEAGAEIGPDLVEARARLEQALKAGDADALAAALTQSRRALVESEVRSLALPRAAAAPVSAEELEKLIRAAGTDDDLYRLRRTLLFAPDRLGAAGGARSGS